ncbi:MAG: anti-sigma factor [Myxacorys chilensis ATA2-1-KO14]|jgi:anti-sigma-K factor RskA|nr:anti-sigma factor [Myxacorys chilensis ATA2-1-KO14]
MAGSLPSEEIELLVAGYVLGDLDAEEAEEFQRLLATDPAIAQAVAQMQDGLELSFAPSEVAPPAHLRDTILNANRASHASRVSAAPSLFSTRQFPIRLRQILELLAAGLIIALAINNYQLRQSQQASQSLVPSQNRLTYALRSTTPDLSAVATVAVDSDSLEGTLTAKNLPPLPPGKVYALWTVLKPGAPFTTDPQNAILTNVFQVDAQGNAAQALTVCDVHRSREWVAAVAVTVEDAAAPQKHQNKPILVAAL